MWCEEDNRYPQMTFIEPSNKPRLLVAGQRLVIPSPASM